MKRAPIVLAGTALGLVGVLSYQTTPATTALVGSTASSPASPSSTSSSTSTRTSKARTKARTKTKTASTPASKSSAKGGSASGQDVDFRYGELEVKVTAKAGKITAVSLIRLNVTDPHSAEIDQSAIPELQQQTLSAQSAKIDGVSGASYTSQAYEQSLQSALDKLGITGSAA